MTERRTTHGAMCPRCSSARVEIHHSRSMILECDPGGRVLNRKQGLRCRTCGCCWWRELRIEERVIESSD
jgi:hypothetical protein